MPKVLEAFDEFPSRNMAIVLGNEIVGYVCDCGSDRSIYALEVSGQESLQRMIGTLQVVDVRVE